MRNIKKSFAVLAGLAILALPAMVFAGGLIPGLEVHPLTPIAVAFVLCVYGVAKVEHDNILREWSIPLIAGVVTALVSANYYSHWYHIILHWQPVKGLVVFGHKVTLHFLINDIFMVFFFGVATKEIMESLLPGGALNPPTKAINPILGTIGGVVGPIATFVALTWIVYGNHSDYATVINGWGVPTATDIALAWLVATLVFGKHHPAVKFLLLLAVADDGIGLGIIAAAYPDPLHPVQLQYLILNGVAVCLALVFRNWGVTRDHWMPTILICGGISWSGLMLAHLHPALALVPIVPCLKWPDHASSDELYDEDEDSHSPLDEFEHAIKPWVDFFLFFFGLCNAGVKLGAVSPLSWIIFISLAFGKPFGIFTLSGLAHYIANSRWGQKLPASIREGLSLPKGMNYRHLLLAGLIAGIGLTVALFVSGEAYAGVWQAAAKMGALFSGFIGILLIIATAFKKKKP